MHPIPIPASRKFFDCSTSPPRDAALSMIWQLRHRTLDLTTQGAIMGILNVTPDSFSDGGRFQQTEDAVQRGMEMAADGAAIIDVGGESTRPGATPVDEETELSRVIPVIRALRPLTGAFISIDTMKPGVAAAALEAGADILNDVTGFRSAEMRRLAATSGVGCVVMHMQGDPRTMQHQPSYRDVVREVQSFFADSLASMQQEGIAPEQIVLDPGIGFGKNLAHHQALLRALPTLSIGDRPLLLGVSFKSFLSTLTGDPALASRAWPTIALTSYAREQGVRILRVHQVTPNLQALRMTEAILANSENSLAPTDHLT